MPALEPGSIATIQEVIAFLTTELELDQAIIDELNFAIGDFTLTTFNYNYQMDPASHQFALGCEIDISTTEEDGDEAGDGDGDGDGGDGDGEEEEAPPPLTAEIMLVMEDVEGNPKRTYGGTIQVPLAEDTGGVVSNLTFDLYLQTQPRPKQTEGSKLIVGKLSENQDDVSLVGSHEV